MAVLVGKKAPHFEAQAVVNGIEFVENFSLDQYIGKKHVVFFFYPKDFTFVCPTELHAFQENLAAFPIVADTNKTISKNYDVLAGDYFYDENENLQADGELIAYRGLFLIDKEGIVRHQVVNDLPLGRNVDEALRMVDALQFNEQHGEACPANWNSDKDGLEATHEGVADYLKKH